MPTRTAFDNFLSKIKPRHACIYKALKKILLNIDIPLTDFVCKSALETGKAY